MEKEKVLKIEITKINEEYSVWYIKYQNEEILKRGKFKDDELNVYSYSNPEYNNKHLYLLGNFINWDKKPITIKNEKVEELINKVKDINKKYGIKKRWRAKTGEEYWQINGNFEVNFCHDDRAYFDDTLYKIRNYFQTKEEAQLYADKIKKLLSERE